MPSPLFCFLGNITSMNDTYVFDMTDVDCPFDFNAQTLSPLQSKFNTYMEFPSKRKRKSTYSD